MTVVIGNTLIVVTAFVAWLFVVLFHLLAPWWRSVMGRHVMAYSVVVAAVLTLSVIRIVFGAAVETHWFAVLRLIVFAGVPLAIGQRIVILLRVQRRADRDDPAGRH